MSKTGGEGKKGVGAVRSEHRGRARRVWERSGANARGGQDRCGGGQERKQEEGKKGVGAIRSENRGRGGGQGGGSWEERDLRVAEAGGGQTAASMFDRIGARGRLDSCPARRGAFPSLMDRERQGMWFERLAGAQARVQQRTFMEVASGLGILLRRPNIT
eukprot:351652-Chlamydomonas_euryale.AAC.7